MTSARRRPTQAYAQQYSAWAARYCVDKRNQNIAAGALIGGVLGAAIGGGVTGRGGPAFFGGALGAGTGASIAGSQSPGGCPPGFVVRAGAPGFVYAGPVYGSYSAPPGTGPGPGKAAGGSTTRTAPGTGVITVPTTATGVPKAEWQTDPISPRPVAPRLAPRTQVEGR